MTLADAKANIRFKAAMSGHAAAHMKDLPLVPTRAQLLDWLTKHPQLTSEQVQKIMADFDK